MHDELLTVSMALSVLRIGRTKLYSLINAGQIQAVKIPGMRATRIRRSDLERWMERLPAFGLTIEENEIEL